MSNKATNNGILYYISDLIIFSSSCPHPSLSSAPQTMAYWTFLEWASFCICESSGFLFIVLSPWNALSRDARIALLLTSLKYLFKYFISCVSQSSVYRFYSRKCPLIILHFTQLNVFLLSISTYHSLT